MTNDRDNSIKYKQYKNNNTTDHYRNNKIYSFATQLSRTGSC